MKPAGLRSGHHVQLLNGGAAFFPSLIAGLDAAEQEVRLETYIFHFEGQGAQVAQALVRAAQRGVDVYVLMDGVGTPALEASWAKAFEAAGVHWHRYAPVGGLGWLLPVHWRRLHRKLAVVDGRTAWCGGINLLDDHLDPNHGPQNSGRLDYAVRLQGPMVAEVLQLMRQFWSRLKLAQQLRHLELAPLRKTWRQTWKEVRAQKTQARTATDSQGRTVKAALVLRDNLLNRKSIERAYLKAIGNARKEILIANAYFLPGGRLRRALVRAARRGVRVRVLLQGRYEYFMQYHAARPVYQDLARAGVSIYAYSAGFLHAKVAVVDQSWATVGSSNLDPLSLLLAREANVLVQDPHLAHELQGYLERAITEDAEALDDKWFAKRPWTVHLLDWLAHGCMRVLLFLYGARY